MKLCVVSALCLSALGVGAANAGVVFFDDFESSTEVVGAGAIESVEGYEGVNGMSGGFYRNESTGGTSDLMLVGLGAHTSLTLEFDLALIDSWDGGLDATCCGGDIVGPDFFNVTVDGVGVLKTSNRDPLSALLTDREVGNFGFNPEFENDEAFRVSVTLAHMTGTAEISFFADGAGYQGGSDESWAIDNLRVSTAGRPGGGPAVVPLPAGASLLLGGLMLLGLGARRREH